MAVPAAGLAEESSINRARPDLPDRIGNFALP